ncbi:MAG: methyltransferase domain-containing protein [Solirubrobacterales bacterium]|nr:methyltransferase domain-containing protein [Solirubrobacterales bacterium]
MEANAIQKSRLAVWERWWSSVDGKPGAVVWDAAESDLVADLEVFADAFTPDLPVVDLGCGDGRQTRFLARHFQTVIGVDISPAAIEHARAADDLENVSYRVLDARSSAEAERLHDELGDANVYIRACSRLCPPLTARTRCEASPHCSARQERCLRRSCHRRLTPTSRSRCSGTASGPNSSA